MVGSGKPAIFVFSTSYHPFAGGAEIAITEIASRLRSEFRFSIITARFRRDLAKREERPEGTIIRVGWGNGFDKWLLLFLGPLAARRELSHTGATPSLLLWGMDISAGSAAAALLKCLRPGLPFLLSLQYGYGGGRLARGRFGLIGLAYRFMLRQADAVTAISRFLAGTAQHFGYRGRVAVIPNGVALERFRIGRERRFDPARPVIITVSRLVPKNGLDTLIRAVAEVRESVRGVSCHILGDGPERSSLEALARSLGLAGEVKFFGSVPNAEVPRYLAASDLFCRPSRSEGLGNAFLEALASGLPVIGTPVEGILDIIADGRTGLFARVDDPADLAEKILRILRDRALAHAIVAEGQRMVQERFSWASIAGAFQTLFRRLVGVPPAVLIATGIYPPDIGGPATYSALLRDELTNRGHRVGVVTYGPAGISRRIPKGLRHLYYFWTCLRQALRYDLIYAQDPVSAGLPALLVARFLGQAFAIRVAGDYAWEQARQRFGVSDGIDEFQRRRYGLRAELLRAIQRFVVSHADLVITPSEYFRRLVSGWAADPVKVHRVYNGLALGAVSCPQRPGQGDRVIFSAGRLVPWKGFGTLIEALRDLPGWRLVIAGDGPERGRLEARALAPGLAGRVRFTGALNQDRLLSELCRATVFVLNTSFESFSFQTVLSMAAGVPVVVTNIGSLPEIVADGEEGILVRPDDRSAIIAAIRRVGGDARFRQMVTANARRKAEAFSIQRTTDELLGLIAAIRP